ncbi:MAG: ubiquinol-cytochrome C chaperone family protein [Pararhizobium sp.]
MKGLFGTARDGSAHHAQRQRCRGDRTAARLENPYAQRHLPRCGLPGLPLRFTAASVNQPLRLCNMARQDCAAKKRAIEGIFMILSFFSRKKSDNRLIVDRLYASLTEAARLPLLYEEMDVPDTVMGRFEMVAAHVILFLRRARSGDRAVRDIAQEIVDEFFLDIDHSIRELGVGDMGVPKKMKKFGRMFYGRVDAYGKALDAGDEQALALALRRNIHPEAGAEASEMQGLASYMIHLARAFDRCSDRAIADGTLDLGAPPVVATA